MKHAVNKALALVVLSGIPCAGDVIDFRLEPAKAEKAEGAAVEKAGGQKDEKAEPAKPEPKKKAKEGFKAVAEKKGDWDGRAIIFPAAPVRGQLNVAAKNEAMVKQWKQQLQPLLLAELNFVRQVCELTEEQRPKIRAAGEKSLQSAVEQFVKAQQGQRAARATVQLSSSAQIQRDLAETLEETLSPEQFANYKSEMAARTAQRKRAAILCVVARLEDALSLSVEQREKLLDVFSSQWRDEWVQWLVVSHHGDQYFPQIPDNLLQPHLEEAQLTLWSELPRIASGSFFGAMGQPVDDPDWWGAPKAPPVEPPDSVPAAAPAAAAPAEAKADDQAALGQVFLQVIGKLIAGGKK